MTIRQYPNQHLVVMSMESSYFYACLDDMNYMYFQGDYAWVQNVLFGDPVPWEDKLDAVAYINSNCGAATQRDALAQAILDDKRLEMHAWGACKRNRTENSERQDYVTEKLYQGLEAGCLPIYLGTPHVLDVAPTAESVLDFSHFDRNATRLIDHMLSLAQNKTAYMRTMKTLATSGDEVPHTQCQLCQLLMRQRIAPQKLLKTHCLHNETWMAASRVGGSSWANTSQGLLQALQHRKWLKNTVWNPTRCGQCSEDKWKMW
ncbi:uncharacterized protein HaLaN_09666 [Haematococcus lacustris]|uniref:Fucosyltransferase n=1 Tax=Haematococcus lacustris TaxID=44745 RepID=A0A699Z370_HAELA|nr:uncharacterized protein HaLaN_09666 [Haematococcus lacustris]